MASKPAYVFYGHHKCATMTFNTVAGSVCRRHGLNFRAVYDEEQFQKELDQFCVRESVDFLSYGNADVQFAKQLPAHRGVHIIRDPRDIIVSAYFSHLHSHATDGWPKLVAHRESLQNLSREDGLLAEIEFRSRSLKHIAHWDYSQRHILEIRFEDFVANPSETFLSLFNHLELLDETDYKFGKRMAGLYREVCAVFNSRFGIAFPGRLGSAKLPSAELLIIAWRNRFQARTSGREQGEENTKSHYRKGKVGDWRAHFGDGHKQRFKSLYPGLVPSLGYEDDDDW